MNITDTDKTKLSDLSYPQLIEFFTDLGEKTFRARQVYRWIHQKGAVSFDEMTDLSKYLRADLIELAEVFTPKLKGESPAPDKTTKLTFKLYDGNVIESVIIPSKGHTTLCISTQAGCKMNCRFCYTASLGFSRNLSAGEITGQYHLANNLLKTKGGEITNVVLMGMGEPLDNYDNVLIACQNLMHEDSVNLSSRRVVLSTSGLVPQIERLIAESPVSLSISLNATTDSTRSRIMPVNKRYNIASLVATLDKMPKQRRKRVVLEYVMLKDVNDSQVDAKRLAGIARRLSCKVNLIPFNPHDRADFEPPTKDQIDIFHKLLVDSGVTAIMRQPRGQNIHAACGMLGKSVKGKK